MSDHWAATSPATGRLDAFEWTTPKEQIGAGDQVEHLRSRPAPADTPLLAEKAQTAAEEEPHAPAPAPVEDTAAR